MTCFIRLSPAMAKLEGCDWSIKLNLKLESIYPDRLINLLVRMDIILLIISKSCTFGAIEGISNFLSQNAFWVEKGR